MGLQLFLVISTVLFRFKGISAKTINSDYPLNKYIGEYSVDVGRSNNDFVAIDALTQTSYYFISEIKADYNNGLTQCQAELGDKATLLKLDTDEELTSVFCLLAQSDDDVYGSEYWIGANFDADLKAIPEDNAFSAAKINSSLPHTRLTLVVGEGIFYGVALGNESLRYICELQVTTRKEEKFMFLGHDIDASLFPVQTKYYFISPNKETILKARSLCKSLGTTFGLADINRDSKASQIPEMFKMIGINQNIPFWTGGICNPRTRTCTWSNGDEVSLPVKWLTGNRRYGKRGYDDDLLGLIGIVRRAGIALQVSYEIDSLAFICHS